MKISILQKMRAPSRIAFCEGLVCEAYSPRLLGRENHRRDGGLQLLPFRVVAIDFLHRRDALHELKTRIVGFEVRVGQHVLGRDEEIFQRDFVVAEMDCVAHRTESERLDFQASGFRSHFENHGHVCAPFEVQFSTALLPQRLAVSCDSDNTANIAYMSLEVKHNRKSLYFRAFSGFVFWIKKFSSPKIKIWFEPMFFSGFFCGFERCGSAAFPNFRGGIFLPKCVRTNSRILHQKGKVKEFWFASLRSATNLYSILGVKTNSRFRKIWFEPMFFRNVVIAVGLEEESRLAA